MCKQSLHSYGDANEKCYCGKSTREEVPFLAAFLLFSLSSAAAEPLSPYLLWEDICQLLQESWKNTPERDSEAKMQPLTDGSHFPKRDSLNLPPN